MGNCNTRLLPMVSNGSSRRRGAAEPASVAEYAPEEKIRSRNSDESTFLFFENQAGIPVKLYWINYDGQEIPYRCLQPGGTHRQQTFMTHPWTFKAVTENPEDVVVDDCRVVLPDREGTKKTLQKARALPWTTADNTKFPNDFKKATKELLLLWNHQRYELLNYEGDSSSGSESDLNLGIFPSEIVLKIIEFSAPYVPIIKPLQ
eukprot:CAMPEP_0198236936 /NCGR_PEP_ID=MMETSP1446-20131203/2817_1 /TAXON_ID=1461542 ORGANISM="Unidentified sp, Strain CCMP2111" /NCGR_SAMPLE_ID=MMETSP1446 /ASSEMBLY_ACC=CAM_ASM_001112 /LENGTH=203 /DNA_ID=CAMNT_0043918913 /DNA_START=295 /DNA_END=906 /DNA_ORIENTATION=+